MLRIKFRSGQPKGLSQRLEAEFANYESLIRPKHAAPTRIWRKVAIHREFAARAAWLRRGTRVIATFRFPEIPGRWRRHCPHGPMMSGPGCNLIGEGTTEAAESGNAAATGKCVCGPSVPWCPGEPRPYMYTTRHECKLNLEAKIAYGRYGHIHSVLGIASAARRRAISKRADAACRRAAAAR